MSTVITPNDAELEMLETILNYDYTFHLYKNNHTPSRNSTLADFEEASFVGYSSYSLGKISISESGWLYAPYLEDNVAVADHDIYSWTCTSTEVQTVYGYYITSDTTNQVILAEKFNSIQLMNCNIFSLGFQIRLYNES